MVLDATSWRAPRSGGRRAPKGLMPFGFPHRATEKQVFPDCGANVSRFRLCVGAWKSKHQHGRRTQAVKQMFLPSATLPCLHKFQAKTGKQKFLPYLFAFGLPKANAKAESLTLRANMSRAAVPRRVVCARTNGFQRRSLRRVSWTLLAAKQEVS